MLPSLLYILVGRPLARLGLPVDGTGSTARNPQAGPATRAANLPKPSIHATPSLHLSTRSARLNDLKAVKIGSAASCPAREYVLHSRLQRIPSPATKFVGMLGLHRVSICTSREMNTPGCRWECSQVVDHACPQEETRPHFTEMYMQATREVLSGCDSARSSFWGMSSVQLIHDIWNER